MSERQPVFNIPVSVVAGILAFVVLHLVRMALPDEDGLRLLLSLAFIPARYAGDIPGLPGNEITDITSFITYQFVHGDTTHLVVNSVWMLAFGSAVAKRIGNLRFIAFSLLCGIAGALAHLAVHFGEAVPVVGASAAISGQMAAAIRIMFGSGSSFGARHEDMLWAPIAGIGETLTNPKFLAFLGVWVALNLLFGLGGLQIDGSGSSIAWEAHIGGFVCGLFAIVLFDRVSRKLRFD